MKMLLNSKDVASLIVGVIVLLLGVLQLTKVNLTFLNANWFTLLMPYLFGIFGLYLAVESIIELSNSNAVGWISFIVGFLIMVLGIFNVVQRFGIAGFIAIPSYVYHIVFILLGLFLIIATYAMEP